ncbi:DUF2975 domain-containing protein [Flavobacterium cerinum]|uniref:DUF2975 domain-containing protein n=1 Tax=Flavobacterium cerinum TaxID=2502784 RepID=A0A444HBY7_9FLAO|nr:DUF2975 domain-containing protein [Flavobacterium cerinum]RWX00979.1 DUF2975 domain-containing protein [Flavobacterium cerinum]
MSKRTNFIFKVLHIVAWIIFVGLCIEAGGLVVNFIFSIYKPEFIPNLYQKLDLIEMYKHSQWAFFGMYAFIISIAILKAYLFYIVIILIHKLDLSNPFNSFVSKQITRISSFTFLIGIVSFIGQETAKNLQHSGYRTDNLNPFWEESEAFILMAAIIYIIAIIFKRGIEIQTENDLTI